MKKQLQGISLILFGILLILVAMVDPWIPIVDGVSSPIFLIAGIVLGIVGVFLSFKSEK